jgi:hypothetical protein
MMKKILFVLLAFLLVFPAQGFSQEEEDLGLGELGDILEEEEEVYKFPEIPLEWGLSAGFKYVELDGSERAAEFEYLKDYIMLGGELRLFEYPHRVYLDIDVTSKEEYFGDFRYALKDIVLFRSLNRSLFHNLENLRLVDLDPSTSTPGVEVRDSGEIYGTSSSLNVYTLRLKTPDFPLHGFLGGWFFDKEGTEQQISLLGSGTFNNIERVSEERDIDYKTRRYTFGANSHLGPVEVEYSHVEKSFDADGDVVMTDSYDASAFRPEGVYLHNQTSEFEGSMDSLKLHTSYTGRLVASATLTLKENENTDSNAEADYFMGSGGLFWMPLNKLLFTLRYSHRDVDVDNPSSVTVEDLSDPSNVSSFDVRDSISSTTDKVSLTGRYSPFRRLTVKAKYSYKQVDRTEADEWNVEDSTKRHKASVSANARLFWGIFASANYTHEEIDDPSYNTEPDSSDEGLVSVTWTPVPRINALLSYGVSAEERGELSFTDTTDAENRDVLSNNVIGSLTFLLHKNLSVTATYAYIDYNIEQDIVYESLGGASLVDPDVELEDESQVYALNVDYAPTKDLTLGLGVTYTESCGEFMPESADLTEPESIGSFSDFDVTESSYTVYGGYEFWNGFNTEVEYIFSNVNDEIDNIYDDIEEGDAHIIMLKVSKRWM